MARFLEVFTGFGLKKTLIAGTIMSSFTFTIHSVTRCSAMKTKYTLVALAMGMSATVMGQEIDDMYFNAKDRLSLNETNLAIEAKNHQQDDLDAVRVNPVNASDSYSGRGVNPEYNAQPKNGTSAIQGNPDYFLAGYQPTNVNSNLYNGATGSYSSCNCGSGSPSSMGYNGFSSPYSSFYSPYSSFYSPYSSFYPGWTTSIGYMSGAYGSGFYGGISYGMGGMYGSPYGYSGYGYGYGGYPSSYSVATVPDVAQSYGRRASRSSSLNNYVGNSSNGGSGTNGRVRDSGNGRTNSQSNYYDPTWRNNAHNFATRDSYSVPGSRTGSFNNSSWNGNSNGRSTFDSGRTRSSFDSFGSGSRGSFGTGGGSIGGGSSGHSRGRN